jgi:hypothetical protein
MTTDNHHFNAGGSSDNIVQTMPLGGGSFDTPAYYNGQIYYVASQDAIRAYIVSNGTLIPDQPGTFGSRKFPFPGATPSISANGATNGIAWAIQNGTPAVLVAFNATNLTTEIYNSSQAGARDQLTNGVKFVVPTVANGKVYVGGRYALAVFGLRGGGLGFSSSNYIAQANAGSASVTVNRSGGSIGAVQVGYATTPGGTAIDGQDYVGTSGTLSWANGDSSPKNFDLTILANPQAETNKTVFLTLSNATGGAYLADPTNAVLTIIEAQSPYALWKSTHFGTNASNPAVSGDAADPDNDGIPNILEYAFGSDPNSADTNRTVTGAVVSNYFQLQFNRNTAATDLTYSADATADFSGAWTNLVTYVPGTGWVTNTPGSIVTESAPTGSPPDEHVQVTITDPGSATDFTRFFRLHVQP